MKIVNKYNYILFQLKEKYNEQKNDVIEISDEEYERFINFMNSEDPLNEND